MIHLLKQEKMWLTILEEEEKTNRENVPGKESEINQTKLIYSWGGTQAPLAGDLKEET